MKQQKSGVQEIHLDLPLTEVPVSRFSTPRSRPELYPGTRPSWSFCFMGRSILPIRLRQGRLEIREDFSEWRDLAEFILDKTGVALTRRYAVLAVGSNACPARLADPDKFGSSPQAAIPVLRGWMDDVGSVYAPRMADYRSVPSTIMGLPGSSTKIWVTLLTQAELRRMDMSEGRGRQYDLLELPSSSFKVCGVGEEMLITPLGAYYEPRGLCDNNSGQPILLDCFEIMSASLPRMNQREIQNYILNSADSAIPGEEINDYIKKTMSIPISLPTNAVVLDPSVYLSQNAQFKGLDKKRGN